MCEKNENKNELNQVKSCQDKQQQQAHWMNEMK
mgnify:CR=1 FL=1